MSALGCVGAYIDLEQVPIWFGTPELPERVDAKTIVRERARAVRAGILPVPVLNLSRARKEGGPLLAAYDKLHLLRDSAALVERYAPQERELVERLLQR